MKHSIWIFKTNLSRPLLIWAAGSSLAGGIFIGLTSGFWEGFGIQALAWGIIDCLIAGFGLWMNQRRRKSLPNPDDPELLQAESRKLRRVLWINTGLDLLYIAVGITLAATGGRSNPTWRGHGWGIVLQGAFLFFFDWIHAQSVPPGFLLRTLKAFNDPIHRPFLFDGGRAAALLVHGFPGTPADTRPLGEILLRQGWTVQGILLPGFGTQFGEILERGYDDWLRAVAEALRLLKQKYSPVLLVGYSLGGALSLAAATQHKPDGLILLAPFWRLGTPLQRLIGTLLRPFLPRYFRPLHNVKPQDPKMQDFLLELFPDIDLSDPVVQSWLRDLQVPIAIVYQIMKTGKQGYRSARSLCIPALVLQGSEDDLVRPQNTRMLVKALTVAGPSEGVHYLEIPGGHNIIDTNDPSWSRIETELIEFSRSIREAETKRT